MDWKDFLTSVTCVLLMLSLCVGFVYGVWCLGSSAEIRKKEKTVAVLTRVFAIASEDAVLIYEICRE